MMTGIRGFVQLDKRAVLKVTQIAQSCSIAGIGENGQQRIGTRADLAQ